MEKRNKEGEEKGRKKPEAAIGETEFGASKV